AGALALNLGQLGETGFDGAVNRARIASRRGDQVGGEAFRIVEQDLQNVVGDQPLVTFPQRQHLCALQETAHSVGVLLLVHFSTLSFAPPVSRRAKERTLSRGILAPIWGGMPTLQDRSRRTAISKKLLRP